MFKWKKLGQIFNPASFKDRPSWMHEFAQAPSVLILEDYIRVYFSCRPKRDVHGQFVSYSAFVDLDRRNLFNILNISKLPILKLGTLGTFDEFGTYPVSVIKKDGKVLAYYAGWTRCESVPFNVAIGCAISADGGESFDKLGAGPILSYSPEEPFTMSGPKIRIFSGKYYLFYIAGKAWVLNNGKPEISHKIRMATSFDGMSWSKCNRDLIPDHWDDNESQASPDVIYMNGKYHMFFCGWVPSNFRETKSRKIGYAYSTDLINWIRDDSKVGIDVSGDGFDSEMVAYPHVFELDDKIYMLYLGNEVGRFGFGLAVLEGELI
jgi:predicted GH43/DUF377 family glycosyl hydrolase